METLREVLRKSLEKDYKPGSTRRRFHPKSHGLVDAIFTVEDNLPVELREGLFREAKSYKALIRFSNAPFKLIKDHERGERGRAIKVLDTGQEPLDPDNLGNTQDFVLNTANILAPGRLKMYVLASRALFDKIIFLLAYILNPLNWPALIAINQGRPRVANILETEFFSATPYLYGEGKAVKWHTRPNKPSFAQADILEQATELSLFTLMGDPNHINDQASQIGAVTKEDIDSAAKRILNKSFSSTLHYLKKK